MKTVRLTMAQALVRYLTAQRTIVDRKEVPLFAGVFAIFGHGNVTCLGEALEPVKDELPTWRGQNEQSMALAAIGFTKAMKRRQIMVSLSSIGPGSTNMVTAAAVAMANRLPVLFLGGDTFAEPRARPGAAADRAVRRPDPHGQRLLQAGRSLLGPHHAARADHLVAAAGGRHHARPGELRAGLHRPRPGRPGRGLRLPVGVLREDRASHPARPARCRHDPRGGEAPPQGEETADRRRRRRRLLARRRSDLRLCRETPRAGRRDHQWPHHPAPRRPDECRADRHPRRDLRERARRGGRRRDRGRHAAPGFRHRLVDRVRRRHQDHRPQRGALRRPQAPLARGGRRRAGRHRGTVRGPHRLEGAGEVGEEGGQGIRGLERAHRQGLGPDQRRGAELRPGGRRVQPHLRPDRPCADRRRRIAGRALSELAGEDDRHLRLRVRLFLHGLRDRRRLGAEDGQTPSAT